MATTVQDIIDQALGRSTYSDGDVTLQPSEAIARVSLRLAELFAFVNALATPEDAYFGVEAELEAAEEGEGWVRPADADIVLALFMIGETTTDEVRLVPYNDRESAEPPPRVYPVGNLYRSVGAEGDPDDEDLLAFYARTSAPLDPTKPPGDEDNTLDSAWPERFNLLLVVDLALYLMAKDHRFTVEGGAKALQDEQDRGLALLEAHVTGANRALRSRFAG